MRRKKKKLRNMSLFVLFFGVLLMLHIRERETLIFLRVGGGFILVYFSPTLWIAFRVAPGMVWYGIYMFNPRTIIIAATTKKSVWSGVISICVQGGPHEHVVRVHQDSAARRA